MKILLVIISLALVGAATTLVGHGLIELTRLILDKGRRSAFRSRSVSDNLRELIS